MSKYQVIVGNVGTVYDGDEYGRAYGLFHAYKDQSQGDYGRAAGEEVTWMRGEEIYREFRPKLKTPTIADLAAIIINIKGQVDNDCRQEGDDEDAEPSIQLTIGCGYDGWGWQSGDNSYTGGAYQFPYWGVGYVTRRCNSRQLAKEIINDAHEQLY